MEPVAGAAHVQTVIQLTAGNVGLLPPVKDDDPDQSNDVETHVDHNRYDGRNYVA